MAKDLGPFLLETTEDTLSLVLETLQNIVEVGHLRMCSKAQRLNKLYDRLKRAVGWMCPLRATSS